MIGAPNTRGQKYWVGIVQWAPETSVLEEIADIFRNYDIDIFTDSKQTQNSLHDPVAQGVHYRPHIRQIVAGVKQH